VLREMVGDQAQNTGSLLESSGGGGLNSRYAEIWRRLAGKDQGVEARGAQGHFTSSGYGQDKASASESS